MHYLPHCPGKPKHIQCNDESFIKDCSACDYPHRPENYRKIIGYLTALKLNWMEENRRQDDRKYRTFFEESKDAIIITSREGVVIDCNWSALVLLGYTKEEAMRLNVRDLYVNPDDRKRFQQQIEQKGYVKDYRVKLCKKDGARIDCLFTFTLLFDGDGNVLGYQGIVREIGGEGADGKGKSICGFPVHKNLPAIKDCVKTLL